MAVLVSAIFLVLHVRYQPFRHDVHNHLETVAYSALTLTYFIGLLMQNAAPESQYHAYGAILVLVRGDATENPVPDQLPDQL